MALGVPAVASSFVGRKRELAELTGLCGRQRLVTVVGPGGCGKTRLAIEAVGSTGGPLHGFVELAPADPSTALADLVAAACGLRDEPGTTSLERLHDHFRHRAGLLVLDNCEHVRDAAALLVTDLLRHCPTVRVLATSRVGLGVPGEAVLPLTGLAPDGDGLALFLDRARLVQPAIPAGERTAQTARDICRLVDGLPLGIELAAAHARSLSLTDIREGMSDGPAFPDSRDPGALPQHRSLAASVGWSLQLVGPEEREALAALSIVRGRFTLGAALAAGGVSRATLAALGEHSLLQLDPGEDRYVLLDTVREAVAGTLGATAAEQAHDRLLAWVACLAADVRSGLEQGDPAALYRVQRDEAAVGTVLRRAVRTGRGLDVAAGVVADLTFAWSLRGRCAEGADWAQQLCAAFGRPPAALLWAHAFLRVYSGDFEDGLGAAADAAEQAAAVADHRTGARARILAGLVQALVDPAGAEPVLVEAVRLARAAGDDWGEVEALQSLAYSYLFRSATAAALRCADEALDPLARSGHPQLRAWDAAIRAEVAASLGDFGLAVTSGRQGRDLAMEVGEPVSADGALLPLLRALVAIGRADEASRVLEAHQPFIRTHPGLGAREAMATAAAIVTTWSGSEDAAATARAAVEINEASGLLTYAAETANLLAVNRLCAGDVACATATADRALEWARSIGDRADACAAVLLRAVADRAQGANVTEPAHAALGEAHLLGLRPLVADALDLLAGVAADGRRGRVAARLHAASDRLRAELGAVRSPLATHLRARDEPTVAALLTAAQLADARAEGARLGLVGAVGYASRSRGHRTRPSAGWDALTPTEREVAELVARGLTNQAVAAQLLVAPGTVRTHLRSIFGKLGLTSRTQLATHAVRRDL